MNALVSLSVKAQRQRADRVQGWSLEYMRLRMWLRVIQLLWAQSANVREAWRSFRELMRERKRERPRRSKSFARLQARSFFALYAPGFPSRAFDKFASNEIARADSSRPAPVAQTAIFAITTRCGLSCEHCCEWKDLRSHEALSVDQLHDIASQIVSAGASQLFLSGGEPLLRFDDLLVLVERFRNEADLWVLTAGGPLTATRARRLREAGLTGISLSLDHWNPDEHDAFRGKAGTFEGARVAAAAAREAGLVLALSLCPTRRFVSALNLRAYRDLAREWGAAFIQVLEPRSVGRYEDQGVELGDAQKRILESWYEETNSLEATGPAVAYSAFTERRTGCPGAADRLVYIDTRGTLHPCPFCREGTACLTRTPFEDALKEIRTRGCGRSRAALSSRAAS